MQDSEHAKFMRMAIELAEQNVSSLKGGPFGAVVVKDGEVVARSANKVTSTNDPTAHAEVSAIRLACKELDSFDLSGCVIYTSCEPCPMCLGAIYWSRIQAIYYGNTKQDAAAAGFNDQFIYEELDKPAAARSLPARQLLADEAAKAFEDWNRTEGRIAY
ncbi:tRNA-specific adenosine deaminase [Pedobacter yulinensis]|uniref:tRNA-specific adenosine deaminase n=1 Tax=Pedobacter yulinensis TaxID=2126353 RepID=A0A2T3HIR1_9SPHI|nr:nucleoside deaminase [Pedobacter yulinensis]PST82293.1 tRNA-specific adenosine deaminase [Pedobacter yulinensis]